MVSSPALVTVSWPYIGAPLAIQTEPNTDGVIRSDTPMRRKSVKDHSFEQWHACLVKL
jgi:hypothetical protein